MYFAIFKIKNLFKKAWLNKNIVAHLELTFQHSTAQALFSSDFKLYNTGFFVVKSTAFTCKLFFDLIQIQRQYPNTNEQLLFNKLIETTKQMNSLKTNQITGLDPILYANGKVFFQLKLNRKFNTQPYTVHANYMIGEKNKTEAFKSNNLWLID